MSNGKWIYERAGAEIWDCDEEFDTKEQAIEAGKKYFKREKELDGYRYDHFEVGQKVPVSVSGVDVDGVLEFVAQQVYDEVGEVAEYFLDDVTKEDRNILEHRLDEVFFAWVEEFNYTPEFFKIEDSFKVSVED